jgi:hypothetical protein
MRFEQTESIHLSFDRPDELLGAKLIVIDDAYVTGTHEYNLIRHLDGIVDELHFIYIVNLKDWPVSDKENKINKAAIKNPQDLLAWTHDPDYLLNARVVKFLLSYPSSDELQIFFSRANTQFLVNLRSAIDADGYSNMLSFHTNIVALENELSQRSGHNLSKSEPHFSKEFDIF